jgi:signal transduction histidine kinase/CheY-like chemotaxis protein
MMLVAQADYCIFLSGLILAGLAVAGVLLDREDRATGLAWRWLAGFGAFYALHEWLKLIAAAFPNTVPVLEPASQVLRWVALLSLFEFGRQAVPLWIKWRPGPWFFAPWLAVTLAAAWFFPVHATWTVRVFLLLPAILLAAVGLAAAARRQPWRDAAGLWLTTAGLAGLVLFSIPGVPVDDAMLFAGKSDALATPHHHLVLALWMVLILTLLVGQLAYWDRLRRQSALKTAEWSAWFWLRWLVFVLIVPVLLIGWGITQMLGSREQQALERHWETTAQLTAAAVGGSLALPAPMNVPNGAIEAGNRDRSRGLMQVNPQFRDLIIWTRRDGGFHRLFHARRDAGAHARDTVDRARLQDAWRQFQNQTSEAVWTSANQQDQTDRLLLTPLRQATGDLVGMVGIEVDGGLLAAGPQTQRFLGITVSLLLVLVWSLWAFLPLALARRRLAMELRENAERFRLLFSKLDACFVLLERIPAAPGDPDGYRLVEVNPAFEELAGLPRATILGRPVTEHFPQRNAWWMEVVDRVMQTGVSERMERDSTRFHRYLDFIFYRPFPTQVAILFTDVTERQRLRQQLQEAQKMESLGLLAGGIAHDFNNLLMIILGNTELARFNMTPDSETTRALYEIQRATLRAAELSKQMLVYAGRSFINPKPLALNTVIEETLTLIESSLPARQGIHRRFDPLLPVIAMDEGQTRQLVVNLVTNAVEALGDSPGDITVTTGVASLTAAGLANLQGDEAPQPGDYLYVEVTDSGSGMDPETRRRMFDPFFSTKFTGRGLGLAAVLGIIRGHHGVVKVRSAKGHGATITVYLPCPAAPLGLPELPCPSATEPSRPAGLTLLVTDDDPDARFVMCRHLTHAGYHTLEAADGREAVQVFTQHRQEIAAILLDLKMPNMNGEEAFAEIQRLAPNFPILLVSGYSEDEANRLFAGRPWSGFLQKPFTSAEMLDQVRAILNPSPPTSASHPTG